MRADFIGNDGTGSTTSYSGMKEMRAAAKRFERNHGLIKVLVFKKLLEPPDVYIPDWNHILRKQSK